MDEEITGLSSMATRRLLGALSGELGRAHLIAVRFTSAGGVEVARRVREGAEADVVVLAETAIAELDRDGFLLAGSLRAMFVSEVVAAVPMGLEPPPFATESEVVEALCTAERIAYSTGPSGTALICLIEELGLNDRVAHRFIQAPPGVPVGALLALGEADLGFQQRSELMDVGGIQVLGPLPGETAITSTFSGAILATSPHQGAAADVLRLLGSHSGQHLVNSHGMELVTPI